MSSNPPKLEASNMNDKIAGLVEGMRSKGHKIPSEVSELPDFPAPNFRALRISIAKGELIFFKRGLNYNADLFNFIATRSESTTYSISVFLMYLFPAVTVLLAIIAHWYWILLLPLFFYMGWKLGRSTYMKALFRISAESEMMFCFLFSTYKIGVAAPDFSKQYVWQGDMEK